MRAKQKGFFEKIGVNECFTRIGVERLGVHGFYSMPPEDMQRFGVTEIVMGPGRENDIDPSVRAALRLTFVKLSASQDAHACDGAR